MSNVKFVTPTHTIRCQIGDDRMVTAHRAEDGSVQLEWDSPEPDNGAARMATRIHLSEEAATATALVLANLFETIQKEEAQAAEAAPGGEE